MELLQRNNNSPEERVRESFRQKLILELGYPSSLLISEKELSLLPHLKGIEVPKRRLDLLCLEKKTMRPLLLVECKAIPLTSRALDQVIGYNFFVQAPYLTLVNQTEIVTLWYSEGKYCRLEKIPFYADIESQTS
ncbi:MAG: type I restriction enzyme HsdR N-terminal domain-containing protein [Simkaniaceae bacterium]|nr:type I restriction enzyme HsdR N-terminal domain-containing protein [Simkaniaceae bacterium]